MKMDSEIVYKRFRHKKRGSTYLALQIVSFQTSNPSGKELDGVDCMLYMSEETHICYVRPKEEFFDGRFEEILDD